MQARYYDPALGRFLSNDPAGFTPGRPDMFNRYAYAANDPVNMVDPDGLECTGTRIGSSYGSVCGSSREGQTFFLRDLSGYHEARAAGESGTRRDGIYGSDSTSIADARDRAAQMGSHYEATRTLDEMGPDTFSKLETATVVSASPALLLAAPQVAGGGTATVSMRIMSHIVLYGGRGGQNVKNLIGPANAAVRGGRSRVFVTNNRDQVVLDITRARVKPVTPGQGFGPKRPPSPSELELLQQVLGGGS